jgi:hypothetical protein
MSEQPQRGPGPEQPRPTTDPGPGPGQRPDAPREDPDGTPKENPSGLTEPLPVPEPADPREAEQREGADPE